MCGGVHVVFVLSLQMMEAKIDSDFLCEQRVKLETEQRQHQSTKGLLTTNYWQDHKCPAIA